MSIIDAVHGYVWAMLAGVEGMKVLTVDAEPP
jgi:hypothetical protein